jgi:hypothetical protein
MKIYYHVSRDIDIEIKVFVPKIPLAKLPAENRNIKRVCISEHIMDCMNAINYIRDYDVYNKLEGKYKPLRVYKFELDEKEVMQPANVIQYVHDALKNNECWSLNEIIPVNSFIIEPTYIATEEMSPIHIAYLDFDLINE